MRNRRKRLERCDHCGKFVSGASSNLYTLEEEVSQFEDCEDIWQPYSICMKCSESYQPEYWRQWILTHTAATNNPNYPKVVEKVDSLSQTVL